MSELTKAAFDDRFQRAVKLTGECVNQQDIVSRKLQLLASDAWDHAENLQEKLAKSEERVRQLEAELASRPPVIKPFWSWVRSAKE